MNRFSIRESACDGARAQHADLHADDTERIKEHSASAARLHLHTLSNYDWMDHHSTFETQDW